MDLGSSLTVASFASIGESSSVLDFVDCSSALSLRSYLGQYNLRLGSSLSVVGLVRTGSCAGLSVFNDVVLDSSLSVIEMGLNANDEIVKLPL